MQLYSYLLCNFLNLLLILLHISKINGNTRIDGNIDGKIKIYHLNCFITNHIVINILLLNKIEDMIIN